MNEHARAELIAVIRQVRKRWRTKLAIRGAVGLPRRRRARHLRHGRGARLLPLLARVDLLVPHRRRRLLLVGRGRLVLRPAAAAAGQRRTGRAVPRGARAVAREHDPHRDGRARRSGRLAGARAAHGRDARSIACTRSRTAPASSASRCAKFSMAVGAVSLATLLAFTIGPALLRQTLSALFVISRSLEAAAPYRIEVKPGDATVPKGADQTHRRHALRLRRRRCRRSSSRRAPKPATSAWRC